MRLLFFYCSDLFYPSGSAVVYRRVFEEIMDQHQLVHVIGFHRAGRHESEIALAYKEKIPEVRPVFLALTNVLRAYYRLRRHFPFDRITALPGSLVTTAVKGIIAKENPDLIWWSGDYLPESFSALLSVRKHIPPTTPLHVSIMDPPEVFAPKDSAERGRALTLYHEALKLSDSVSCVGELLRSRIRKETNKKVFLLNDYIETSLPRRSLSVDRCVRVAIAGRVYNYAELELFLRVLGDAFSSSELLWYGAAKIENTNMISRPPNVRLLELDSLPRERMADALAAECSFGYLSMPSAMPEFAIYSVPTKLVTYVEAGLPVAFHAPANSEVNLMNARWQFGINLSGSTSAVEQLRGLISCRHLYANGLAKLAEARYSKKEILATVQQILATTRTKYQTN